jgi:DNA mismatch endonuclease (patch repair protein)
MQRTRDSALELAVRGLLLGMKSRYRIDRSPLLKLPWRANILFGAVKV